MTSGATRNRTARVLVAVGIVVALGVPVGWWVSQRGAGPATVGSGTAAAPASSGPPATAPPATPPPATPPAATPSGSPTPVATLPSVPTVAGAPGRVPSTVPAVPTRLQLPSVGIDAPVDVVGLDANGAMALPEPVERVGWYRFGASPASAGGATVVAGHVDSAVQGEGALFDLREAGPGADVLLTTDDGRVRRYTVVSREEFDKYDVPLDAIFAATGPARLVLITCGGPFDAAARSYEDNIVVTAVPA